MKKQTDKIKDMTRTASRLMLALLAGACLGACSDKDETVVRVPEGTALGITARIDAKADDANFKSQFAEGDKIGVFAVERTDENIAAYPAATGNYVHNACWVYKDGQWTPMHSRDAIAFPGKMLDIYAYYPYDSENSDPTNIEVVVPPGNTLDLLTARTSCLSEADLKLEFRHKFAMLRLTVPGGNEAVIPSADLTVRAYFLSKEGGSLNLSAEQQDNELSLDYPDESYVAMTRENLSTDRLAKDVVYTAFVPAQTILKGNRLFRFARYGHILDYMAPEDTRLAGTTNVTANFDIQLDPAHAYKAGDLYPYAGLPVGLVFEVSDGGLHGKVISLDSWWTGWGNWGTPSGTTATGATNEDDGRENHKLIEAFAPNWQVLFPAFAECRARGSEWYLGAVNELTAVSAFYIANKAAVDKAVGGKFQSGGMTSNEKPTNIAYALSIDLVSGNSGTVEKIRTGSISPMRRF